METIFGSGAVDLGKSTLVGGDGICIPPATTVHSFCTNSQLHETAHVVQVGKKDNIDHNRGTNNGHAVISSLMRQHGVISNVEALAHPDLGSPSDLDALTKVSSKEDPLGFLACMFARDVRRITQLRSRLAFPMDGALETRFVASDGTSYEISMVTSKRKRYLVVFSQDCVPFSVSCPVMFPCDDVEKQRHIGSPVLRNNRLKHANWRRDRPIPGLAHVTTSLLRLYSGGNGAFLSCILTGIPGLKHVNVEILYHCLPFAPHCVSFESEISSGPTAGHHAVPSRMCPNSWSCRVSQCPFLHPVLILAEEARVALEARKNKPLTSLAVQRKRDATGCELCGRSRATVGVLSAHHLIPRSVHDIYTSLGFTSAQLELCAILCLPCHSMVHRTEPNDRLAAHFYTVERLKSHPLISKYLAFLSVCSEVEMH